MRPLQSPPPHTPTTITTNFLLLTRFNRDAHARFSAEQVLDHPWLSTQADAGPGGTSLATPDLLRRNNSSKDLAEFAENAIAVNRLVLQHMAFSQGPAFRVRGRSLARDGDSDREAEEEERTSSFEEQRASSNLANLDVSGFFVNELESGHSPRLDISAMSIRTAGGSNSSSNDSSRRASGKGFFIGEGSLGGGNESREDFAGDSFISAGSDDDDDDDLEEPGSSSGSSGSSGFGSFYGTSVETVINARLSSVRRSRDLTRPMGSGANEFPPGADVVKASGFFASGGVVETAAFPRDRGDVGDFDAATLPSRGYAGVAAAIYAPLHLPAAGGHVSRPRNPRGSRGSLGKPPLPSSASAKGDSRKKRLSMADEIRG